MNRPFISRHLIFRLSAAAILVVLISLPAFAITLEEHKARNADALWRAEDAEYYLVNGEGDEEVRNFVKHIRDNFPPTVKIEWYGGTADASNEWLLRRADDLQKQTVAGEKLAIVREMREYLSTIEFKLRELETAVAETRSKDEDKQKLAEILRREEYQKPQAKEESLFTRLFREFIEWLENIFPKPKLPTTSGSGMEMLSFVLQILFYVGLAALLVLLIIKVAPLIFPSFKRQAKPKKKKRVILGEDIAEHETAKDIFGEAERLAREGDLRGAIRKGYIALLCELADKKVIGLSRHKTNRDYLRDVRTRRELHPRMKSVTDTFERHWYGFQKSGEHDWTRFREEYNDAIRSA